MAFEVKLSKSEGELVDAAREFTAAHVTPNAGTWERDRIYPRDAQLEAAARGLGGVLVPQADGGQGASFSAACRVFEELAYGCMAFTFSMVVHNNFALSLASNGSDALKQKFLPDLIACRKIGAFLLTEPGMGSDAQAVACMARPDGDGWVLDGEKAWISSASHAGVLSIYAQTIGRETAEPSRSGVAAEVFAKPLAADAFAPYGEVLALGQGAPGTRESFAAAMDNLRDDARLNVSISRPAETPVPLKIEWMERHPFSGQTFVPVDISRYLMMVAPSDDAGNPDLERLEAFVARSDQGINYRAGVWHHPFTALDRPAECVVFRFDNGSDRDTDWFEVSDGPSVGIEPPAGQSG